jgi:ABC-type dipeptide/oligopeptide/nickel transport system permease component
MPVRGHQGRVLVYALRRLAWTVRILLLTLTLVFFVLRGIGGDPLRHGRPVGLSNAVWVKSGDPKPEAIERNMRRALGFDRPLHEQYLDYLRVVATLARG